MLFSPQYVALLGIFVYILIWLASPLKLVFPVSWGSIVFILGNYLAFIVGCLLTPALWRDKRKAPAQHKVFNSMAFWVFAVLGVSGMLLKLYDKYYIRGLDFGLSSLDSREVLMDASAGPLAVIAGVFYPFCYVPLFVYLARARQVPVSFFVKPIAIILFLWPSIDALTLLSRSTLLVAFGMIFFSLACYFYQGRLLHPKLLRVLFFGLVIILLISSLAFSSRLGEMDVDIVYSILNSVYGFAVTPTPEALADLGNKSMYADFLRAMIPLTQYYTHGIFEFGLLWSRPDGQIFTMGVQHFAPYFKALGIFGFISPFDYGDVGLYHRYGVFTSFFGALWVDFYWFAPVFMILFGMLCNHCAMLARQGNIGAMPLHAYFCVVIFFMPVVNFIISAQGMYVINSFFMAWVFLRLQNWKSQEWFDRKLLASKSI